MPQKLLALLDAAISSGDLLALEQQAQSFAALPTATAGSRATDDSFNYPLPLLLARLNAIQSEVNSFTTVSGRLLDILANETTLVDELLAADTLAQWAAANPQLEGAWSASWDFSIGQGPKPSTLPPIDPANQVEYDADLTTFSVLDCTTGTPVLTSGLRPPVAPEQFPIKNATWSYPAGGIAQTLYAPDMSWAQLDLLEALPLIDFSAPPAVEVLLPQGVQPTRSLPRRAHIFSARGGEGPAGSSGPIALQVPAAGPAFIAGSIGSGSRRRRVLRSSTQHLSLRGICVARTERHQQWSRA